MDFDDIGTGIPLVLIHGFPLDRTMWAPQVKGLRQVARCITPDLPGFGGTSDAVNVMTMEDHAVRLKALLSALLIEKAVICGFSMGGYVALAFLQKYPDSVQGLVLCSTRSGADGKEAQEKRKATAARVLESDGMAALAPELAKGLLSDTTKKKDPSLLHQVEAMIRRQPPAGVAASSLGMGQRPDRTYLLKTIQVPTLLIAGTDDTLIKPQESRDMAAMIPGSTLVMIPDAGHMMNMEDPVTFNAAMGAYMGRFKLAP